MVWHLQQSNTFIFYCCTQLILVSCSLVKVPCASILSAAYRSSGESRFYLFVVMFSPENLETTVINIWTNDQVAKECMIK